MGAVSLGRPEWTTPLGSGGKVPRLHDRGAGRLAPQVPAAGWALPRPCTSCVPDRLSGSAVIAPVPRAAAGLYGRPGASAVRPARPVVMPWPAPRAFAPGGAVLPVPSARGFVLLRAGWPYMEADTRDSPPFRGVGRWERQRTCGTPAECGTRACARTGTDAFRADDHG